MLAITRADQIGLCGQGGGDDVIIIGIVFEHARYPGG
jgi:hypothetical protein